MKIIIIGAVAGGTSAGAKARRNDENAEIVIYEKDQDISYSGCGLPYYIGGKVGLESIVPRTTDFFKAKYNIDVFINHEVLSIDLHHKTLSVKDLSTNITFVDTYDKLIISTGASAFVPSIKGIDSPNVFFLRNVQNAIAIKNFIEKKQPKTAVVVGTGFIGFEVTENLASLGISVTVLERAGKITPNLDEEMSNVLEELVSKKGISILTNANVVEVTQQGALLDNGDFIPGELILIATGVKPNVALAKSAGILIGASGGIKVDQHLMTIDTNVFACGDCIETWSLITQKPYFRPLGSTANKTGRIVGENIFGKNKIYPGNLSTGIFKLFDITVATTGLSENEAKLNGYDYLVSHDVKPNKPGMMGGREMTIKTIVDKKTQQILGVQIIGYEGVDKRLDVFVTLITLGAKVDELVNLDLGYAPPFSTVRDPIHYTGMILDKQLNGPQ
ncbi:MAG: FAD-dependent oxidoreductase [Eubacteriaceae bacterium]